MSCDANINKSSSFNVENEDKFKCLIANDDHMQLYIIKTIFEMQGFDTSTA